MIQKISLREFFGYLNVIFKQNIKDNKSQASK